MKSSKSEDIKEKIFYLNYYQTLTKLKDLLEAIVLFQKKSIYKTYYLKNICKEDLLMEIHLNVILPRLEILTAANNGIPIIFMNEDDASLFNLYYQIDKLHEKILIILKYDENGLAS